MAKKKISDLEELTRKDVTGNEVIPLSRNGESYRAKINLIGEFIVDNFGLEGGGGGEGGSVEIVDNLESMSTIKALSANMGRVLDEKITQSSDTLSRKIDNDVSSLNGRVDSIQTIMNGQSQSIQKLWSGVNGISAHINQLETWHQEDIDALNEAFEQADNRLEEQFNEDIAKLRQELGDSKVDAKDSLHCSIEVSNSGDAVARISGNMHTQGYSNVLYVGGREDICQSVRFNDGLVVFARTATYIVAVPSAAVVTLKTRSIGTGLSLERDHTLSLSDEFRIENKGVINVTHIDDFVAFMRTKHTAYGVICDAYGNVDSNNIVVDVPLDVRMQYNLPNKLNVGDMLLKRNGELHVIANGLNKDRVTITQDYYDDGSGSVVPVKHPDLATQPNILPYKLAGNYVYEQLMAIPEDVMFSTSNGYVKFSIDAPKWEIEKPSILKATLMSSNVASVNEPQMCMPCIVSNAGDSLSVYVSDVLLAEKGSLKDLWLLLEYSSFDARGGYYYERSNEVVAEEGPTDSKYNLYINVEDGYTWEINGKQYNTGLHKLSDEEVTHLITTSNIFGSIKTALDDRYAYMKATLEGSTETRNVYVSWSKNVYTLLWSCNLVYYYETYSGVYSLSYHLPMAAEAIANGEKVILELTNTY